MRLIQELTMPIKYIPFNFQDLAKGHEFLISMGGGQVASLTFNF
jgi:hypothetical protein